MPLFKMHKFFKWLCTNILFKKVKKIVFLASVLYKIKSKTHSWTSQNYFEETQNVVNNYTSFSYTRCIHR